MKLSRLKTTFLILALLIVPAAADFDFSPPDLTGRWRFFNLTTVGDSFEWERATAIIDDEGLVEADWLRSDDHSGTSAGQLNISDEGFITIFETNFQGKMSPDKNMMVFTDTWNVDQGSFGVAVKDGASFSDSDLEGIWHIKLLSIAEWGTDRTKVIADIAEDGQASLDIGGPDDDSGPDLGLMHFAINSEGIITIDEFSDFQGKMSPDKNLFVFNQYEEGQLQLAVAVKTGELFAASDLTGTWEFYFLATDGSHSEWITFNLAVNEQGHTRLNGFAFNNMSVSSDGIVAIDNPNIVFQGIMSPDKNLIISTNTWEENRNALGVAIRTGYEVEDWGDDDTGGNGDDDTGGNGDDDTGGDGDGDTGGNGDGDTDGDGDGDENGDDDRKSDIGSSTCFITSTMTEIK